jgi:antitoxin CptB
MSHSHSDRIDQRSLSKLHWRCRRGLLENDLLIERFFQRHQDTMTQRDGIALASLMDLSDNELLDIFMGRTGLPDHLADAHVQTIVEQIRCP